MILIQKVSMESQNNHSVKKTVLATGVTGAFGEQIIRNLLAQENISLILLVRASSNEAAYARVENSITDPSRVIVYAADLSLPNLGLQKEALDTITEKTTHILHGAASTRFNQTIEKARESNVKTTENMLFLARKCPRLQRFAHISTALVAGKRSGLILESDLEHSAGFLNTYQQSKYEAEQLVRSCSNKIPTVILRPPLLISPFKNDSSKPTNSLTLSIFLARRGLLPLLPGTPESTFDIMDSEIVAKIIVDLLVKKSLKYDIYHITSGANTLKVKNILQYLEKHMGGEKLPFTFTGNIDSFNAALRKATLRNPALGLIYNKTKTFLPEVAYPKVYDNRRVLEELNLVDVNHNAQDTLRIILS